MDGGMRPRSTQSVSPWASRTRRRLSSLRAQAPTWTTAALPPYLEAPRVVTIDPLGTVAPASASRAVLHYIRIALLMARGTLSKRLGSSSARTETIDGTSSAPAAVRSASLRAQEASGGLACRSTSAGPFVSAILPVYNARRHDETYLRDAIRSVLEQNYGCLELLIVDDGSSDDSASLARSLTRQAPRGRVRHLSKPNGGQSSARNLAALQARGDWLAFIDQDDLWTHDKLRLVTPLLTDDVDLVYTDADTIDEHGRDAVASIHRTKGAGGRHPKQTLEEALFQDVFVMPGLMTIRKSFFLRLNGFDEDLSGYEDDDLFIRMIETGRVAYLPVATLKWRIYAESYSWTYRMADSRYKFWKKLMESYAPDGRSTRRARAISFRFFRQFLVQAMAAQQTEPDLTDYNLQLADELVSYLPRPDRLAFRLTRWSWKRQGHFARFARHWMVGGSDRPLTPFDTPPAD